MLILHLQTNIALLHYMSTNVATFARNFVALLSCNRGW